MEVDILPQRLDLIARESNEVSLSTLATPNQLRYQSFANSELLGKAEPKLETKSIKMNSAERQ